MKDIAVVMYAIMYGGSLLECIWGGALPPNGATKYILWGGPLGGEGEQRILGGSASSVYNKAKGQWSLRSTGRRAGGWVISLGSRKTQQFLALSQSAKCHLRDRADETKGVGTHGVMGRKCWEAR